MSVSKENGRAFVCFRGALGEALTIATDGGGLRALAAALEQCARDAREETEDCDLQIRGELTR